VECLHGQSPAGWALSIPCAVPRLERSSRKPWPRTYLRGLFFNCEEAKSERAQRWGVVRDSRSRLSAFRCAPSRSEPFPGAPARTPRSGRSAIFSRPLHTPLAFISHAFQNGGPVRIDFAILADMVVTKPVPNFTRLDPSRPEIAILMDAMVRAREVVAARSWSTSQEPIGEHWWADVLADPTVGQDDAGFRVASIARVAAERSNWPTAPWLRGYQRVPSAAAPLIRPLALAAFAGCAVFCGGEGGWSAVLTFTPPAEVGATEVTCP
jgi:hypothetical protein